MRYAAIFDAHIGYPGWQTTFPLLLATVQQLRSQGYSILWAGDTLDWVLESGIRPPEDLIRPDDMWLPGNHDPELLPGLSGAHYLCRDGVFVVHGDDVDLGWLLAQVERVSGGRLRRDRKWQLYRLLVGLPDWATRVLQDYYYRLLGGRRPVPPTASEWRALLTAAPIIPSLLMESPRLYPPLDAEALEAMRVPGPTITHDPDTIAHRLNTLYPEARRAHTLVIGHLHQPMDAVASTGQRVVVAPAWIPGVPHGYVAIEEGKVTLEVLSR